MRKIKYISWSVIILITLSIFAIILSNKIILSAAKNRSYDDVQNIPYRKTGLLLGTSKFLKNGQLNYYYKYRIDAAVDLISHHKIKYLIVSGDNGTKEYDEPSQMRTDLINAGIDSTIIFLDYAGFRTFDSMVRLKEIFSQDSVIVISQKFHNERAIYIAKQENIDAIGLNAKDVNQKAGLKVRIRERFARVKVFADYLFNKQPKYLGVKVSLP